MPLCVRAEQHAKAFRVWATGRVHGKQAADGIWEIPDTVLAYVTSERPNRVHRPQGRPLAPRVYTLVLLAQTLACVYTLVSPTATQGSC